MAELRVTTESFATIDKQIAELEEQLKRDAAQQVRRERRRKEGERGV